MQPELDRATDCGDYRPPTFSRSEVRTADHHPEFRLLWWVKQSKVAQGNPLAKVQGLPHNLKLGTAQSE